MNVSEPSAALVGWAQLLEPVILTFVSGILGYLAHTINRVNRTLTLHQQDISQHKQTLYGSGAEGDKSALVASNNEVRTRMHEHSTTLTEHSLKISLMENEWSELMQRWIRLGERIATAAEGLLLRMGPSRREHS